MSIRYDVIVAGGGPAGVAAAMASARRGARTLVVDPNGYLGGYATNGNLPALAPYTDREIPLIRGIGLELLTALQEQTQFSEAYSRRDDPRKNMDWFPIDGELLKRILDQKVTESGCEVLLHTQVIDCVREGGAITGVKIFNQGGIQTLEADVFIDCTGDAALSAAAGCEIEFGDENGDVQSGTLCFKVANFDEARFAQYSRESGDGGNLFKACGRAIADGAFIPHESKVSGMTIPAPGTALFNFGHVYDINPLDATSITRAEMEARSQLPAMMDFLHKYVPGAENAVLASSGPTFGVRESRRVMGRYVLTREDYMNRADFDDAIVYFNYPIDVHNARKDDVHAEENDTVYKTQRYRTGECYGIPYRCLTPRGVDNLLTAGRIISCDRHMLGSVRVVPCCFATGQAAGTAAAMAVQARLSPAQLDPACLRDELRQDGCYLR